MSQIEEAVVVSEETELSKMIALSGLAESKGLVLKTKFDAYFTLAEEWKKTANSLVITDVSQVKEMKQADEARKMLKAKRVEIENTRKELKEASLKEGRAIDDIAAKLTALIEPIEKDLAEKAKFKELFEAKQKAELKAKRMELLSPYNVAMNVDLLGEMDETMFDSMLAGYRKAHEEKLEAERIAEEKKIAEAEAEKKRLEEQAAENARLKLEAEAREKELAEQRAKAEAERKALEEKARKEREEAEAKLRAERERAEAEAKRLKAEQEAKIAQEKAARERAEAELKAKAEAEAKRKEEEEQKRKAEELAARKAASAPDKEKLLAFAKMVSELQLPEMKSEDGKKVCIEIKAKRDGFVRWMNEQSSTI